MSHWDEVDDLKLNLSGNIENILKDIPWEEIQRIDEGLKSIQDHYTARERIIDTVAQVTKLLIKIGVKIV